MNITFTSVFRVQGCQMFLDTHWWETGCKEQNFSIAIIYSFLVILYHLVLNPTDFDKVVWFAAYYPIIYLLLLNYFYHLFYLPHFPDYLLLISELFLPFILSTAYSWLSTVYSRLIRHNYFIYYIIPIVYHLFLTYLYQLLSKLFLFTLW
jgi:hypothetical protein